LDGWIVYGKDKNIWMPILRKEFGELNLSKEFGGKRDERDILDLKDVLRDPSLFKCVQK
jgi:hypothetical protein